MSTKETEITVIIPNSKLNDPDFVTAQLHRAKLRILLEVSKSSDRKIESLIQEFLPDVLNNSLLLHEYNLTETGSDKTVNSQATPVITGAIKSEPNTALKIRFKSKPKISKGDISNGKDTKSEISEDKKPTKKVSVKMRIKKPKADQVKPLNNSSASSDPNDHPTCEISEYKEPTKKKKVRIKSKPKPVNNL
jgi:hypothetical protein